MSSSDPDEAPTRAGGSGDKPVRPKAKSPETEHTMPSLRSKPDGKAGLAVNGPAAPAQQQDPLVGVELGGCRIEEVLGRGAMGAVYRSKQLRLDREVAVKVIRPELMVDQRMLKRFEVEARMVGRFNSPHVVMVHDVGFERGVHFLVMEFVRGKNLRDYVKLLAGGRMQVADAIPLLRQACRGLEEAQRLGVLHRDIKPDNLMLTDRGVLKIADFGIAKPLHEDFSMTLTSELIGTPLYMSPEQCHGAADLDFRSDMYSLGATFYYLLTGEPPIRASSVYELIQTKTKLEHLSLWKTLPELDENHPLSRVIEKMTALDRADRYESYEALLGDLVLVQQGRTMEIKRPPSKQQKGAPKKSGRAAGIATVVVLALGAGGWFGWQEWGPKGEPAPGPTPPLVVVPNGNGNVVDVGVRLAELRQRLAMEGPMPSLRRDVDLLEATGDQPKARETLLADIDQGVLLAGKLTEIKKPAKLELPFADLGQHFDKVSAAVVAAGTPCPELKDWIGRAEGTARAEAELSAIAESTLVTAWANWQDERSKVTGDEKQIAALSQRLGVIDEGRRNLLALLSSLEDKLQQSVPLGALEDARRNLTAEAMMPVKVDCSAALGEIRKDFAELGPLAAIGNRLETLRPTEPEQQAEKANLLNEIKKASDAFTLASTASSVVYPANPRLPFDDVEAFFKAVTRALDPLLTPESTLPAWAAKHRDELQNAAEIQPKVVLACRSAWETWQRQGSGPSPLPAAERTAALELLQQGIAKACELFPTARPELEKLIPPSAIDKAKTEMVASSRRDLWIAPARETVGKLAAIKTLLAWREAAPLLTALTQHKATATDFAADAEVQAVLDDGESITARWREADKQFTAVASRLRDGDLTGAVTAAAVGLSGEEGKKEFEAIAASVQSASDAFAALDPQLDIARALSLLAAAQSAWKPHARLDTGATARLAQWSTAVAELQRAADGMVAIGGGRTRQSSEDVAPFFLSRTEATQADFQRFLDEVVALLEAAGAQDPAAKIAALQPRLGDVTPSPDVLENMLARRTKLSSPADPIDYVCWYEAAACAKWFKLSLPTEGEWALAAFGNGNGHAWPWDGPDWKEDDAARNLGTKLVAAASGGLSWRSGGGATVHHLAGNAAEWLQAVPGAREGNLAGGRCSDDKKAQRERAAGKGFHRVTLSKAMPECGFRTILRVRDYLAPSFKDGKFPASK